MREEGGMPDKLNLLFITTDEHRFDYLGFLGKVPVRTPTMDALAAQGIFHPNAYSVNPLCMPSRCSWLTGLYSHQHGMNNNSGDLNRDLRTFPKALQKLGYFTALVGKEHFYEGNVDLVKAQPYTRQFGFDYLWSMGGKSMVGGTEDNWTYHLRKKGLINAYRHDLMRVRVVNNRENEPAPTFLKEEDTVDYLVAKKACEFLDGYTGAKPFFLHLSFCNPHFPHDPVAKYAEHYQEKDMPVPPGCPKNMVSYYQRHRAAYAALCEQVDAYMGNVISKLKEKKLYDNTFIIFTSDHGHMLGDLGLTSKSHPYDGSARVPFIAAGKKIIKKPGTNNTAVENLDIVATFLEVAGAPNVQEHLLESPSKSLVPLWNGKKFKRKYAFSEEGYQFEKAYTMVCDGAWKYINFSFSGKEELYNLKKDPHEQKDLSKKETKQVADMRKALIHRLTVTPIPRPAEYIYTATTGKHGKNPNQCFHKRLEDHVNTGILMME